MGAKSPLKRTRDLLAEVGIKPGEPMQREGKLNEHDGTEPDHQTLPQDLERAADYLDEYAKLLRTVGDEAPRAEQCVVLAKSLRKRAAFRRSLTNSIGELEQLAQAKAQENSK